MGEGGHQAKRQNQGALITEIDKYLLDDKLTLFSQRKEIQPNW